MRKALTLIGKNTWRRIKKEPKTGFAEKGLGDVPNDSVFWDAQEGVFMGEMGGLPNELLLEGTAQAERLGLLVNFDLVNQQVLDFSHGYTNQWWSGLDQGMRQGLRTAISTHIESGAPLSVLRDNLTPLFGRRRADMIAATETTRLFAEGNRIAYRQAGVTEVEWRSVMDERVCIDCDSRDGQRFPINDPKVTPPLHVRCRCWIAPVVAGKPLIEPPVDLSTVDIEQAYDDWTTESETMMALLRGERISVGQMTSTGGRLTEADIARLRAEAMKIREMARTGDTGLTRAWRGESYKTEAEIAAKYELNSEITLGRLTAASDSMETAQTYALGGGDEWLSAMLPEKAILRFVDPKGIRGTKTYNFWTPEGGTGEVLLPDTAKYKVVKIRTSIELETGQKYTWVDLVRKGRR